MKDLLSREIERKYQRTVSVYRGKDDEKPLFSVSTDVLMLVDKHFLFV